MISFWSSLHFYENSVLNIYLSLAVKNRRLIPIKSKTWLIFVFIQVRSTVGLRKKLLVKVVDSSVRDGEVEEMILGGWG